MSKSRLEKNKYGVPNEFAHRPGKHRAPKIGEAWDLSRGGSIDRGGKFRLSGVIGDGGLVDVTCPNNGIVLFTLDGMQNSGQEFEFELDGPVRVEPAGMQFNWLITGEEV